MLLAPVFLAACSGMQRSTRDDQGRRLLYDSRLGILNQAEHWQMTGKLAISDGESGGSGRFQWNNDAEVIQMNFYGALGRGAWRLNSDSTGAVLEYADGQTYIAERVEELAESQLGWEIPVDALSWWVRGLAAPGEWEQRELDEEGRLKSLIQRGWVIEYGRYSDISGIAMPTKVTASRQKHKVRLAVRTWALAPADPSPEEVADG